VHNARRRKLRPRNAPPLAERAAGRGDLSVVRVLVVGEEDRARQLRAMTLEGGAQVAATAADVEEAERLLAKHAPDVVVVDAGILADGALEAVLALAQRRRKTAVLVVVPGQAEG
jgi:chemotaxis response regulator CheB